MQKLFAQNHALIVPFVNGKEKETKPYSQLRDEAGFTNSLNQLNEHVINQNKKVKAFLKEGL